ncbi:hypothetical protein HYS94_00260, partial [Candidatus Daviesbacteria bacterium]|nr:hypothetical protein [Candidatus Daviesbacteria bacterium]
ELKKEIASKAALLKQQVNQRLQNKAYVGSIKTKTSTSLTLASVSGPKMVTINQDTVYESRVKSRKKFSQKDLKEEDEVAALGEVDEIGVLTAKKIVLLPTTNSQPKTYLWGQIVSISDKLATLKNRENKNVAVSLPSSASVKANEFVILTGSFGKKEIFNAEFIFTTQGGVLKNNKTSTPSATPKKK